MSKLYCVTITDFEFTDKPIVLKGDTADVYEYFTTDLALCKAVKKKMEVLFSEPTYAIKRIKLKDLKPTKPEEN